MYDYKYYHAMCIDRWPNVKPEGGAGLHAHHLVQGELVEIIEATQIIPG